MIVTSEVGPHRFIDGLEITKCHMYYLQGVTSSVPAMLSNRSWMFSWMTLLRIFEDSGVTFFTAAAIFHCPEFSKFAAPRCPQFRFFHRHHCGYAIDNLQPPQGLVLCQKATIFLHGPPIRTHYCHCTICQSLHSAPYALVAVYLPANLTLPQDADDILTQFSPKDGLNVYRCHYCGVAICSYVKNYNVWAVYVGAGITLGGERIRPKDVPEFEGVMHMFYGERQRHVQYSLYTVFADVKGWISEMDRIAGRKQDNR